MPTVTPERLRTYERAPQPPTVAPADGGASTARWAFLFFFTSGFCGLVYQVVWLRLIMAQFGVNAPVVSIVLSTFMAGLGLGSYLGGRLARGASAGRGSPLALYGIAELIIASSAMLVPPLIGWGHDALNHASGAVAWGSGTYFLWSGLWIACALFPWCVCMGTTFPLMIAELGRRGQSGEGRRFSYLYLANVVGAAAGTLVSAFVLIELLGLHGTLRVAAALNVLIGASAVLLALKPVAAAVPSRTNGARVDRSPRRADPVAGDREALLLLVVTGATSMALEVVWLRLFVPYLGTVVYVFACVLAAYLVAGAAGTSWYRKLAAAGQQPAPYLLWLVLAVGGVLPLLAGDPRLPVPHSHWLIASLLRVGLGVVPFSFTVGFVTPALVDRWSGGDAAGVGTAYAFNVIGCIAGPLLSGFLLLPLVGERWALVILTLPLLAVAVRFALASSGESAARPKAGLPVVAAATAATAVLVLATHTFEDSLPTPKKTLRDYEATSIATGTGMERMLRINGIGITNLTPITKMMAHMPLAHLGRPAHDVLIIAFGMGTTFRSSVSWDVQTTAVDLVPSVPKLFSFFHADADQVRAKPVAHIVTDDGRRYLERRPDKFDVIVIDPPPPIETTGSSLLYSSDFYAVLRSHLRPDGILAQWYPDNISGGDPETRSAVVRSLLASFPYVRAFRSLGGWGVHFLASSSPIPQKSVAELARAIPPAAQRDLVEWGPGTDAVSQLGPVIAAELDPRTLIGPDATPKLSDDRPVNEYYFVRRRLPGLWRWWSTTMLSHPSHS